MKINSTSLSLALGAIAFSTLLAPGAYAGCGKELVSRLSVSMPGDRTAVRPSAIKTPSADATPAFISAVGLWTVNVSVLGQVIYQAFEAFTSDGLEFLNDNGSPLEGNVCFGTWSSSTLNTMQVYHPAWNYDPAGNLIGTVVIKEQLTLDPTGTSLQGTVTVDTFDNFGHVAAPQLQADITGKRVTPN